MSHNDEYELEGLTYETLIDELREILMDDAAHVVPITINGELMWAVYCQPQELLKTVNEEQGEAIISALMATHKVGSPTDVEAVRTLVNLLNAVLEFDDEESWS